MTVTTEKLEGNDLAKYSDAEKTVTIDTDYLMNASARELTETAFHEARHSYQHAVFNLYRQLKDDPASQIILADILDEGEKYAECFATYKEDGLDYYMQYVEEECRAYSEDAYADYVRRITEIEEEKTIGTAN